MAEDRPVRSTVISDAKLRSRTSPEGLSPWPRDRYILSTYSSCNTDINHELHSIEKRPSRNFIWVNQAPPLSLKLQLRKRKVVHRRIRGWRLTLELGQGMLCSDADVLILENLAIFPGCVRWRGGVSYTIWLSGMFSVLDYLRPGVCGLASDCNINEWADLKMIVMTGNKRNFRTYDTGCGRPGGRPGCRTWF